MLSPNPYVVLDPTWIIVASNPAYLAVTGRQADEIIGENMFDAFPSDPASASGAQLRRSLERVVRERVPDHLPLIRYDIDSPDGAVEERYWSATHTPHSRLRWTGCPRPAAHRRRNGIAAPATADAG